MTPPTPPPPPPPGPGLEVHDLTVSYGRSVRALADVSLAVPDRGVVALLGPNGAGKSTLLRALSGTLRLHGGAIDRGTATFDGTPLNGRDAAAAVTAGIVQVPEGRGVFPRLTVQENLRCGTLGLGRRARARSRAQRDRVLDLFPVLAQRRGQPAGLLSGGEQQMLAMGRALMASPRLLLLDEPSLGLAPLVVARIAALVREINAQGTGVLVVEQNAAMALELSYHAYVLEVGELRLQGPSAELAASDEVRRLYLGEGGGDEDGDGDGDGDGQTPAPARTLRRWAA
ncbi:ABC transporter ATP-binding protein [Kitasatospora sp. NPDC057198]|uniref:ABC transporter ATP-binding protein n=1 Tax=Kitasatospora sp. NPDC057198 TaxID=3346046 RepID=UPI00362C6A81